jgi:hypothetical protein
MQAVGDGFQVSAFDIEGCFPNMPKSGIKLASMELIAELMRKGYKGVWVPRARTKTPCWCPPNKVQPGTWMPLPELLDILNFALDYAFVRMPDGRILWQKDGIPMGGPLSPGMTILTCAWMEREWLAQSTAPLDRLFFRGARYMDDILLFSSLSEDWERERFLADFTRSECYWAPLKLEQVEANTFLETSLVFLEDTSIGEAPSYRLKNDNEHSTMVWRYHDYRSRLDYPTKRATLMGALRKVDKMASDSTQRRIGALAKCKEFLKLGYPPGTLRFMCRSLAYSTQHMEWLDVHHELVHNLTRMGL